VGDSLSNCLKGEMGFELTCWPRMLFNLIENKEKVEVIPYYFSATTVSHKSSTPYMENPVYKGALAS
jgi:hypothetical protein